MKSDRNLSQVLRGRAAPQQRVRRSEINEGCMEKCVPLGAILPDLKVASLVQVP